MTGPMIETLEGCLWETADGPEGPLVRTGDPRATRLVYSIGTTITPEMLARIAEPEPEPEPTTRRKR